MSIGLLSVSFSFAQVQPSSHPPGYQEIPYYVRKLKEATLDDKRIEYCKLIHDAVVYAELSNKKVCKKMKPMIEQVRGAISAGLDRQNLGGQSGWLASAVDYFEANKGRPTIDLLPNDILANQLESQTGDKIIVFPDQILFHHKNESKVLVESSYIHEAVISPNGRRVAYFRKVSNDSEEVEIRTVDIKKMTDKKVLTSPSCATLLFSNDGNRIFFLEKSNPPGCEAPIVGVAANGGKPKILAKGTMLETVVSKGSYKGSLLVHQKTKHPLGLADQSCSFLIDPSNGKTVARVDRPCD